MTNGELELWARSVVDSIGRGAVGEHSDRVECKVVPSNPDREARQLAGHANAARGVPILWLFGVDERTGPVSRDQPDLATWHSSVEARFDGIAPEMLRHIVVIHEAAPFTAVLFDTSRAPYVVKTEKGRLEVPWREASAARSARHEDLLRILVPQVASPSFEILDGSLDVWVPTKPDAEWYFSIKLQVYVRSPWGLPVVIPDHQCHASVSGVPGVDDVIDMTSASLRGPTVPVSTGNVHSPFLRREPASRLETIHTGDGQAIIEGPGNATLGASAHFPFERWSSVESLSMDLRVTFSLRAVDGETPLTVKVLLWRDRESDDSGPRWSFRDSS